MNFRGEKRSNATHCSTTDPESRLMRKANGQQARLCFSGHALMENRNGLLVDLKVGISQRLRKRVEEIFGWGKTVGGMRRSRFKGRERTQLFVLIVGTAYNLMRMAKILGEPATA